MPVLQFKGKTAVESYHHVVPHHTLDIDPKLSLSKQPGLDGNLIIEGDNLLALKSLLPTHAGRIKCIYIDPPYNTGNEGWVYNDNLTQPQFKEWIGKTVGKEGEDATRHDKWCCMMYPRLQLLRELLADDGILFVSVDDTEHSRLALLIEECFGPDGFLATLIWKARLQSDARALTGVSVDHEYILVYRKTARSRLRGQTRDESKYSNPDNDPRGPWMSNNILGLASKARRPNLHYSMRDPASGRTFSPPPDSGWRYDRHTMSEKIREGRIMFPRAADGRPREKLYLQEMKSKFSNFPSVIDDVHTANGTRELKEVLGSDAFSFPKPSALIMRLIEQTTTADDIILDSFAGSGTTAHAALLKNHEDGQRRRVILVQMPWETIEQKVTGHNICKSVTRERIKRVIEGYSDPSDKKHKVPGLGGEFTYARVGNPLFDEHRSLGDKPASYGQMAKYIWFTETSRPFEPGQIDEKTGKIGEWRDTSYYLLYEPGKKEARALDAEWLRCLKDKNRKKVVYCEKIWLHRDELAKSAHDVRPMLVPFSLK